MSKSFRERITYIDDYFVLRSGWVWLESRIATDINIIISIYVYIKRQNWEGLAPIYTNLEITDVKVTH